MAIDLSIVIVSFNVRGHLERCLQALGDAPPVHSHEVIVVDNASADGSAEAARRWRAVQVIEATENLGFARGTNVGVRSSSGTNLLFLNSDTVVPAGARPWDGLLDLGHRGRPGGDRKRELHSWIWPIDTQ